MSNTELKPCPFCGGNAELDTRRAYRAVDSGHLGSAVVVYCLSCDADMMVCREDVPEYDTDALVANMTEKWNARTI